MDSPASLVARIFARLLGHLVRSERGARRFQLAGFAIVANVFSKALGFLVIIYSTRVALEQLGPDRFGIWITIASIATLLGFLDFGISNALIGRVAARNANGATAEGLAELVTGALVILFVIGLIAALLLLLIFSLAPLSLWFKGISTGVAQEARATAYLFAVLFGLSIWSQGIGKIFIGVQHGWIANASSATGWLTSLFLIAAAAMFHAPMWFYLFATYGVQQIAGITLLLGLIGRGLIRRPSLMIAAARSLKGDMLLREGLSFFVIQIAFAVGWGSNQFILSSILGPVQAGAFGVLQRMFMIVQVALTILNTPLWVMYADAYSHGELPFIKGLLKRSMATTLLCSLAGVGILIGGRRLLLGILTGGRLEIELAEVVLMALWTVIEACGIAFSIYLNGVGRLRPQVLCGIAHTVLSLPIRIAAASMYGLKGLIVTLSLSYAIFVVLPTLTVFRRECFGIFKPAAFDSTRRIGA